MNLTKLNVDATLRFTSDLIDKQIDLTKSCTVSPNLYQTMFMNLPTGNVVGHTGGAPLSGFVTHLHKTDDSLFTTTSTGVLDWYEDESAFYATATMTKTDQAVAATTFIKSVTISFISVDPESDPLVANAAIDFMDSTAPSISTLAEYNTDTIPKKGIKLEAGSNVDITCVFTFRITK